MLPEKLSLRPAQAKDVCRKKKLKFSVVLNYINNNVTLSGDEEFFKIIEKSKALEAHWCYFLLAGRKVGIL